MKLISMTDFVLGTESSLDKHNPIGLNEDKQKRYNSILNYAHFLKQPLALGMFIPCDENGNILKACGCVSDNGCCLKEYEYQQAKERVLFEVFDVISEDEYSFELRIGIWLKKFNYLRIGYDAVRTVEDLTKYNLTLTQSALKQLGL